MTELAATLRDLAESRAAAAQLADATELERYPDNGDGKRVWANHASVWLYPGDRVLVVNTLAAAVGTSSSR
jgi:hypothetical protein